VHSKPLCYTRGTVIPLHLLIESPVQHELDLFSNPEAIDVRLRRTVKYSSSQLAQLNGPAAWKDSVNYEASAVFWPSREGCSDEATGIRQLQGEIRLPIDTKASSLIANFCVEVKCQPSIAKIPMLTYLPFSML
jgi:hypothetical protein